jgi:predicted lipase
MNLLNLAKQCCLLYEELDSEYTLVDNYLIFRGTSCLKDWLDNSQTFLTKEGYHTGFYKRLERFNLNWERLVMIENLVITGHSLGGALAILASLKLEQLGKTSKVITFGSPKCCTRRNVKNVIRFVHNNDLVPSLPHSIFYSHVGKEIYINRHGKVLESFSFIEKISDGLVGRMDGIISDSILDHSFQEYKEALQRNVYPNVYPSN